MSERPATGTDPEIAPKPAPRTPPLRDQMWFKVLAACLAGVMIGYGLSGFAPKTPDWKRDAAEHHALYRGWSLVALSPSQAELQADLAVASGAAGAALSVAALSSPKTLTLKKVQVLGVGEDRLAQALFVGPGAAPIALYAIKRQSASVWTLPELEVKPGIHGGLASATWSTEATDFMLIGQESQNVIKTLADDLSYRIRREGRT